MLQHFVGIYAFHPLDGPMLDETAVHVLGGGIGGTIGAVLTSPLEVVKVRLQSSKGSSCVYLCSAGIGSITASSLTNPIWFVKTRMQLDSRPGQRPITVSQIIRNTWNKEGISGFYRGVSASYFGALETALNFVIYEHCKSKLLWWQYKRRHLWTDSITNSSASSSTPNTTPTSLYQNHSNTKSLNGNSSAGVGAMSTDGHGLDSNSSLQESVNFKGSSGGSKLTTTRDMGLCMIASAFSKAIAITVTYPHEVVRTRLREECVHYHGFFRTLGLVMKEEGLAGLYRGMGTHYIRQVPNSCIMIGTYEFVVFLLQSWNLIKL